MASQPNLATCLRCVLAALILTAGLNGASAMAQTILYSFDGDSAGEQFGCSVAVAGDMDRDGFPDMIVGAWRAGDAGIDAGKACVFSGRDGSTLATYLGDSPGDHFGFCVSAAGDVNLDGWPDVAVGADHDGNNGTNSGSVRVISGRNGATLFTFNGNSPQEDFGRCVRGAGDVNGDGWPDIVVGAPHDDDQGIDSGSVSVFSGRDGSRILFVLGDAPDDHLGWSVAAMGDINGDGRADIVAGAWGSDAFASDAGLVRVFSGATGAVLREWRGIAAGEELGIAVSHAGDIDGDGICDVIAGAYNTGGVGAVFAGAVRVFSSSTGATLLDLPGNSAGDEFGFAVDGGDDLNSDGVPDLIASAWVSDEGGLDSGSVRVFSGRDGALLMTTTGDSPGDRLGSSVCAAGDVNSDGFADLMAGAVFDDNHGISSGNARLVSYPVAIPNTYCAAKWNSLGCLPEIAFFGRASASAALGFDVRAVNVRNNKPGLLLYGTTGGSALPFQGGTLCVHTPLKRTIAVNSAGQPAPQLDCSGVFALDFNAFAAGGLGGNPSPVLRQPGVRVSCQWWGRDPGFAAPNNSTLSNALEFTLGL